MPGAAGVAAGPLPSLTFGRIELYGRTIHSSKENSTCAVPDLPPQLSQESEEEAKTKEEEYKKAIHKAIDDEKLNFDTALELEVLRLTNKISSVRRDEIMSSFELTVELSPLTFMYKRDERLEGKKIQTLYIIIKLYYYYKLYRGYE